MALQTFWASSIIWPADRIDLDDVVYRLAIQTARVGSVGISASGIQETATDRVEVTLSLVLWPLTKARTDELHAWWDSWALYGRPSTLILDRLGTCTQQYEYRWNQFFTRAILVTDPFAPTRPEASISRPLHSLTLAFRQDAPSGI